MPDVRLSVPLSDGANTANIEHTLDGRIRLKQGDVLNDGSSVKLLILGKDDISDDSDSGHTITNNNETVLDLIKKMVSGPTVTMRKLFSQFLTLADNADWQVGAGDFTIETPVIFETVDLDVVIGMYGFGFTGSGWQANFMWQLAGAGAATKFTFAFGNPGGPSLINQTIGALVVDTEYYFSVSRIGNDLFFHIDGTNIGGALDVTGLSVSTDVYPYKIGVFQGGGGAGVPEGPAPVRCRCDRGASGVRAGVLQPCRRAGGGHHCPILSSRSGLGPGPDPGIRPS